MVEKMADAVVEEMKIRLLEGVSNFWELLQEALLDFGYIGALYGGAGLIIAKLCGSTRAMKYFSAIQVANIFIQGTMR
ncbi:MAG: hypothetical protein RR595_12130 [Lysinibacillus sp.]